MEQLLHQNVKFISTCLDNLDSIGDLNEDGSKKKNEEEEKKQEGKSLEAIDEDKELDIATRVKKEMNKTVQMEKELDELNELKQKYKLATRSFDREIEMQLENIGRHFLLNTLSGFHHDLTESASIDIEKTLA